MKLNIRSSCLLIAFTATFILILNPYLNDVGENIAFAAVVGLIIYLIGILIYYATGQLALMCGAQPAIERIIVYNDVIPIGRERQVLNYIEPVDSYQFIYKTPVGVMAIGMITDTERDEIEINSDDKPGISITETRYTWAKPAWQFFARCPKVSAWAIYINKDYQPVAEEIPEL